MLESLPQLIEQYGYFAIALGCFLEGEISVLLGVIAAQEGLLTLSGVVLASIIGTIMADNFWFHLGRRLGQPALARRPHWHERADRVEALLERYGAPVMIGFRFVYGLRLIAPVVLGSLNISPWRFLALESIGAVLWAGTLSLVAIFLAHAVESALAHIQNVEQALLVALIAAALGGMIIYWIRARKIRKRRR